LHAVKTKRLIIFGVLATLVVAYIISIVPKFRNEAEWKRTVAALQSLPYERIEAAVQAFKRDRKITDDTVQLRELVSSGYLKAGDVQSLRERDVLVSLTSDAAAPQLVSIRVHAADGSDIVLMADGGVQKVRP